MRNPPYRSCYYLPPCGANLSGRTLDSSLLSSGMSLGHAPVRAEWKCHLSLLSRSSKRQSMVFHILFCFYYSDCLSLSQMEALLQLRTPCVAEPQMAQGRLQPFCCKRCNPPCRIHPVRKGLVLVSGASNS